jgi:Domain of unknown function (DUF4386)
MTTLEMLTSNKTVDRIHKTSLGTAALIAGIGLLLMVIAAPFAELYVFPRLVVPGNAAETTQNIIANKALFTSAIFGYLITFICDLVVAWALYVYLKPVNENLSLLTAWFRLVYTLIALVALPGLISARSVAGSSHALSGCIQKQLVFWIILLWHSSWAARLFGFQFEIHSKNTGSFVDHCRSRLRANDSKTISLPEHQS